MASFKPILIKTADAVLPYLEGQFTSSVVSFTDGVTAYPPGEYIDIGGTRIALLEKGDAGPIGPIGPTGADGTNGLDGTQWGITTEDISHTVGQPTSILVSSLSPSEFVYKDFDLIFSSNDANVDGYFGQISNVGTTAVTVVTLGKIKGPQGPQGIQGIKGDVGERGPVGPQGLQGTQGPTGVQGAQGVQGPIGQEGPQGLQGSTGPQGIKGDSGISTINTPITATFAAIDETHFSVTSADFEGQKTYNINAALAGLAGTAAITLSIAQSFVFGVSGIMTAVLTAGSVERATVLSLVHDITAKTMTFTVQPSEFDFQSATVYYAFTVNGIKGDQGIQGVAGAIGVQGPAGPQGTVGEQGPAGAQGADGEPGPKGLNARGPFVAGSDYAVDDLVQSIGNQYICVGPLTATTIAPQNDTEHWTLFVSGADSILTSNNIFGGTNRFNKPINVTCSSITPALTVINTSTAPEVMGAIRVDSVNGPAIDIRVSKPSGYAIFCDNKMISGVAEPSSSSDAANKAYVDTKASLNTVNLFTAPNTFANIVSINPSPVGISLNCNHGEIVALKSPTAYDNAATKQYVDDKADLYNHSIVIYVQSDAASGYAYMNLVCKYKSILTAAAFESLLGNKYCNCSGAIFASPYDRVVYVYKIAMFDAKTVQFNFFDLYAGGSDDVSVEVPVARFFDTVMPVSVN